MKLTNILQITILLLLFLIFINYFLVYNQQQKCLDKINDNQISEQNVDRKIYFITPTYSRPVQQAELTRLSHTLLLVPNLHWILVEDSDQKTSFITEFLQQILRMKIYKNFRYTHLNVETPKSFRTNNQLDPNWLKPRGVWQRNEALRWLRENLTDIVIEKGIVYFGDDDNTYDLRLFEEIRNTQKVSVFPVGLVGGLMVEKPLVKNGKVIGFNSIWKPKRKFPIDMSGFAINLQLIREKNDAYFSPYVPRGYQETHLLTQFIHSIDDLEPRADLCTKTLVWHTRTELPKLKKIKLKT
uniref:Galactosylgalactosylxylosylprotein 3-beta-glucuronosyltransferase n=1 Tax=Dermatophagoides pteronyssinus TaxID=6956 RepID=A0A6P6Y3X0_DERPT|nr:galactosylgalactosylxylosylprotein 3-beta-glucuronosyltransferase sqv-8-like [Dermatophagoides pteronyssinus]